ncbi:MAG TPA: hypothetical protein VLW86_13700 [Syntrophorhabdales bacterium]|nr:hypothetical protein [Syntrophorhabdales bacterium]
MSIETSQPIAALTGSVQQKTSQAAFNKQITETSSGTKARRPVQTPLGTVAEEGQSDSTSISRSGIVALETTQNVGSESVIRDKNSADQALAYTESQITTYPDQATLAQGNQTPQQVLALETF